MLIFLMRHVEAQPEEEVERDEDRTITAKGELRLRKAARGLRRLEIFPNRILTSPTKRCLQTAEILADELGFTGDIESVDELAPDSPPEEMKEALKDVHLEQIMLVGHQPYLGELTGLLTGAPAGFGIAIKKGGLVRVDVEDWGQDPPGRLRLLVTAKQLSWMKKKKKKDDEGGDDFA